MMRLCRACCHKGGTGSPRVHLLREGQPLVLGLLPSVGICWVGQWWKNSLGIWQSAWEDRDGAHSRAVLRVGESLHKHDTHEQ